MLPSLLGRRNFLAPPLGARPALVPPCSIFGKLTPVSCLNIDIDSCSGVRLSWYPQNPGTKARFFRVRYTLLSVAWYYISLIVAVFENFI